MPGSEDESSRARGAEGEKPVHYASPELEADLLQADRDFENGDYIELTLEELDRCIETGDWPKWPDGSSL